jgi:CDP-diacylglycerol---serine O-phosphatidyltransferase
MKDSNMRSRLMVAAYVLPNLLTTANLFFGYFSIINSIKGEYSIAAICVLLASIFDVLDGRVARITKGTSQFGVQYDSLCDLISFGLAPAILSYCYVLYDFDRLGWVLCFVFVACGALRLARFNVHSSIQENSDDFTGLPIPMAAGVIVCFVLLCEKVEEPQVIGLWIGEFLLNHFESFQAAFLVGFLPLLAALMVSNLCYRSHKSFHLSEMKPFRLLSILAVVLSVIAYWPSLGGFLFFTLYSLSGIFEFLMGWKRIKDDGDLFSSK